MYESAVHMENITKGKGYGFQYTLLEPLHQLLHQEHGFNHLGRHFL